MIIVTTTWPGTSIVQAAIGWPAGMRLAQTEHRRDFCRVIFRRRGSDGGQPWGLFGARVPF